MNNALQLVMLRNVFYQDNYRRALLMLWFLIVVNCILLVGIIYKIEYPPQPEYFAVSADGRMIKTHPLSDPVVSDDYVLQWSADAVRKAFSLDFIHWREQLQEASSKFTPSGWNYFLDSLKQSNNLDTLTKLKMVSDAVVTGAPQMLQKAVIDGRYAWKVQLPILVTYTNGNNVIPMTMQVTLIVLRMPVEENPERIAINNFLPVVQSSPAG